MFFQILSIRQNDDEDRKAIFMVSEGSLDWFPCPNVGQASTNRDLRLDPESCFLVL